jgi:hAT family C-terminal dimerisation region
MFPGVGVKFIEAIETRFGKFIDPERNDFDQTLLISTMLHPQKSLELSDYLYQEGIRRLPLIMSSAASRNTQSTSQSPEIERNQGLCKYRRVITPMDQSTNFTDELRQYFLILNAASFQETIGPVEFWLGNSDRFPTLAPLALQYLSINATSASVERLFSIAGRIANSNKHGIRPLLLEAQTVVKFNKNV